MDLGYCYMGLSAHITKCFKLRLKLNRLGALHLTEYYKLIFVHDNIASAILLTTY